jgi:hypothetical protein
VPSVNIPCLETCGPKQGGVSSEMLSGEGLEQAQEVDLGLFVQEFHNI